jgi:hypothetical protein
MDKKITYVGIVAFIAGVLVGLLANNFVFTGKAVDETLEARSYTHTKAICNSNKECIDVLISCEKGKVKNIEPVSELREFGNLDDFDFSDGEYC